VQLFWSSDLIVYVPYHQSYQSRQYRYGGYGNHKIDPHQGCSLVRAAEGLGHGGDATRAPVKVHTSATHTHHCRTSTGSRIKNTPHGPAGHHKESLLQKSRYYVAGFVPFRGVARYSLSSSMAIRTLGRPMGWCWVPIRWSFPCTNSRRILLEQSPNASEASAMVTSESLVVVIA